ncbi:hypothetical protein EJD97_014313, partial [Solanum chilense]
LFSIFVSCHPPTVFCILLRSKFRQRSSIVGSNGSKGIRNEFIDTPWLLVAASVKEDLFLSFQHMKREMEEADMPQVKPSVVARFEKIIFYRNSSICEESLETTPLSEVSVGKMKRIFDANSPTAYMNYIEHRVV